MHGLNIVGVIVSPRAAHAAGTDVVGDNVTVVAKLLFANAADTVLSCNLSVPQLSHFTVGAQLAVSAGMLGIVNATNAHLPLASFPWDCLSAAAGEGTVNRTELVSAEPHGILLIGRKVKN